MLVCPDADASKVQAELEEMQKVQSELKGQEAKFLKAVQGLQPARVAGVDKCVRLVARKRT